MAKLRAAAAMTVAGLLLAGMCAGRLYGGWFGFGDSNKSSDANKARMEVYDPNRIATGPKIVPKSTKSGSGLWGLFGMGKQSSGTQWSKHQSPYAATAFGKNRKSEKPSWWSSWFKPKEPPRPKNVHDWMKLKPVRWGDDGQ